MEPSLTRAKFVYLLILAPLAAIESGILITYFIQLKPDVITSCCGSLFDSGRATLSSMLAGLMPIPTALVFYTVSLFTLATGLYTWRTGRGSLVLAAGSIVTFLTGVASLIAFFCLYYYEMPTHKIIPPQQRRLAFWATLCFALYLILITFQLFSSSFISR